MTDRSTQVMAHRGASKAERENTVAAFALAVAMGADSVELDVRRTRDGRLVVHHDAHLPADDSLRGDGARSAIIDLDRSDLPVHVPDLADALDACAGIEVNLEIKNDPRDPDFDPDDTVADATMALLLARGEPQRWLISSFRLETVDRCRRIADDAGEPIRTAWLTTAPPSDVVDTLRARGHVALHPFVGFVTEDLVRRCHDAAIAVNTWTCDDPDRMAELIGWGIDGICTNVPDVALDVLRRVRGARS